MSSGASDPTGWGPDQRLTFDPAASRLSYNFARSIATDDMGRIHVVWYDARDGIEQAYYKRSLDNGATWGRDTRLSDSSTRVPGDPVQPAIAVSGSNVYVVWHEARNGRMDIYFQRSTDAGGTWRPDFQLTSGTGSSAHASIAASGSSVHVVWGDHRDGEQAEIYYKGSSDNGETWGPETRLSATPFESWVPTVAASGENVYVAWVDYRDANEEEYFRASTDRGLTWGPITRLTHDPADSWAPSIAASGDTVHIVWFDRRDAGVTDAEVEARLDEATKLVGLPVEPAPARTATVYYLPPFIQHVQGKLQRIQGAAPGWVQRGGDPRALEAILREFEQKMQAWSTGWEIYYKRSTDSGNTWGPDLRLTSAPGVSARPSIAAAGENLHVVWYDGRDGDTEVYYKQSFDGGETWEPDTRLTNAPGDSMHPSVAASTGYVHVVWHDQRDGNPKIYYKRKPS